MNPSALCAVYRKAYARRWYAEHRMEVLARMKAWRTAHLEDARAYEREQRRRAREIGELESHDI